MNQSIASTRSSELSSVNGDEIIGTSGETRERTYGDRLLTSSLSSQTSLETTRTALSSESYRPERRLTKRRKDKDMSSHYKGESYKFDDHDWAVILDRVGGPLQRFEEETIIHHFLLKPLS